MAEKVSKGLFYHFGVFEIQIKLLNIRGGFNQVTRCNNCFAEIENGLSSCPECGYRQGTPAKELYHLYPGMTINNGRYIVGQVLGVGGFGITYKVWDTRHETVLAIKEYYPNGLVNRIPGSKDVRLYARSKKAVFDYKLSRFLNEARCMARFSDHKKIVNIYDFFEENSTAYIVMEYLEGKTLTEHLKNDDVAIEKAVQITDDICIALKDVHAAGYIHCDVSPNNIFLCSDGRVKLIDFGEARFSQKDDNKDPTLTPGFAAPEQYVINDEALDNGEQGPWTDVYGLGASLYNMLAGERPEESWNRKSGDTLMPPRTKNPNIPENLSVAAMRAMAVEPSLRFQNIEEFREALHEKKPVSSTTTIGNRRKMKRLIGIVAAALAVATAAICFFVPWHNN